MADVPSSAPATSLTGVHKTLVAQFVVLKLVERVQAREAVESEHEPIVDESQELEVASEWARAYATTNISDKIPRAGAKAAAMAKKFYSTLADRARAHILEDRTVATLNTELAAVLSNFYSKELVNVVEQERPAKKGYDLRQDRERSSLH